MSTINRESSKSIRKKRKHEEILRLDDQAKRTLTLIVMHVILPKYLISNEITIHLDMQIQRSNKTPNECIT